MAHWPRTVSGKLFYVALSAVVVSLMVWFVATLPGFVLWALAGVALLSVALYVWRRKIDTARERAWVGEFSFGDVVRSRRAREALDTPHGVAGVL
jgi:membrane protein YdbS with pleckstrin-like domain